jgi:hypothetical protein
MKKKLMSAGFQSPNYTQVPNDFFTLINDMDDAELRVSLVMIRETFGFHREEFKMGLNKLADASGLSRNGAKAGAEAAAERGTFRRTNPDAQGSAEWELIVDQSADAGWSASDHVGSQSVTPPWSASDQQSTVKESIKEIKKASTTAHTTNNYRTYEQNIGPLTPLIADAIKDAEETYTAAWVSRAIAEAAASNARSIKYIFGILAGYKQRGSPDISRSPAPARRATTQPAKLDIDAILGVTR